MNNTRIGARFRMRKDTPMYANYKKIIDNTVFRILDIYPEKDRGGRVYNEIVYIDEYTGRKFFSSESYFKHYLLLEEIEDEKKDSE